MRGDTEGIRWERVKELFARAQEVAPAERAAWLLQTCGADAALRREVESLLAHAEDPPAFLSRPAGALAPALVRDPAGSRLGPYQLVSILAEGGMGAVYRAVRADDEFRQSVAVKLIRRGLWGDNSLRRFRHERQILASLDHPNIARLLDGGTTDEGQPYFVMEFVSGQPITEYCAQAGSGLAERLRLFLDVCAGVEHAHQKLIVHRDLKPANILVDDRGQVKLLDFGIAKALDPETTGETMDLTGLAPRPMTPEYASPEQIRGEAITTAVDVYALGVVLYELLAGRRPYRLTSYTAAELERVICASDPARPSASGPLHRQLKGDLDNVVLKALHKDPAARYRSVEQFAEDIRRHLSGLPVLARPDTFTYRAGKFVRRHKAGVAAATLVVLSLSAGLLATAWQARIAMAERAQAENQRNRAEAQRTRAEQATTLAVARAHEADAERQKAQQRFDEVRSLASSFLFEFHDAIQNLPGATAARRLVVAKAQEYLARLEKEQAGDAGLLQDVADAYSKIGLILGDPYGSNLGDSTGALASLEKGLAVAHRAETLRPGDPRIRREISMLYLLIASVQQNLKQPEAARRHFDTAERILERLRATHPPGMDLRLDWARLHQRRAEFDRTRNDLPTARRRHAAAVEAVRDLARESPEKPELQHNLAVSLALYADVLNLAGERERALQAYQEAIAHSRGAVEGEPHNARFLRSLGIHFERFGNFYRLSGDLEKAATQYRETARVRESISAADSNDRQALRDVYVINIKLGSVELSQGDNAGAASAFERASQIAQQLAAADPKSRVLQKDLAIVHDRLSDLRSAEGDLPEALAASARSLAVVERLAASDPSNTATEGDLAYALEKQGDLLVRTARVHEGLPLLARAAEIRERHVRQSPVNIQSARDSHHAIQLLAAALVQAGDRAQARSWLPRSKEILERLVHLPEAAPQDYHSYAEFLATCQIEEWRDPAAALEYALRAVEATRNTNPQYLGTLAQAHFASGRRAEAIGDIEKALRLLPLASSELRRHLEDRLAEFRREQ